MKQLTPPFVFGFLLFAALFSLSFRFDSGGMEFLIGTGLQTVFQIVALLGIAVLMWKGKSLSPKQLLAIGLLYASIPLAFTVAENADLHFVMLPDHFNVAIFLWIGAALALGMWRNRRLQVQQT